MSASLTSTVRIDSINLPLILSNKTSSTVFLLALSCALFKPLANVKYFRRPYFEFMAGLGGKYWLDIAIQRECDSFRFDIEIHRLNQVLIISEI